MSGLGNIISQRVKNDAFDERRATIRRIFMAHGFTIKDGQTDLKLYVYEAAEALLRELSPAVAVPDEIGCDAAPWMSADTEPDIAYRDGWNACRAAALAAAQKDPRQAFEEFHLGKPFAVAPTCQTCSGHGMIGGLLPNGGGYDGEPCPDCNAPQAAVPVVFANEAELFSITRGTMKEVTVYGAPNEKCKTPLYASRNVMAFLAAAAAAAQKGGDHAH